MVCLALNNPQGLICHKTQPNQTKHKGTPTHTYTQTQIHKRINTYTRTCKQTRGDACGVIVIVVRNGHGETSSIPRRG